MLYVVSNASFSELFPALLCLTVGLGPRSINGSKRDYLLREVDFFALGRLMGGGGL